MAAAGLSTSPIAPQSSIRTGKSVQPFKNPPPCRNVPAQVGPRVCAVPDEQPCTAVGLPPHLQHLHSERRGRQAAAACRHLHGCYTVVMLKHAR